MSSVFADLRRLLTFPHSLRPLAGLALQAALDLAVPFRCTLCGQTSIPPGGRWICYCRNCTDQLTVQPVHRCRICAAEVGPWSTTATGCVHCRGRTLRFKSVVCLAMYQDPLRKALLSAKWSFSAIPMRSLARLLAAERLDHLRSLQIDRVVPIPQHWRQRLVRHFNPAWVIAEELAKALQVPCDPHILRKSRRSRPQKRVSMAQRAQNQHNTFAVTCPAAIAGQRLLLVDDVLTTGATSSEAARCLLKARATECHVAVIARVLDQSA
ncbi:MAG: ComF family protein [Planctomycetota bacterium]